MPQPSANPPAKTAQPLRKSAGAGMLRRLERPPGLRRGAASPDPAPAPAVTPPVAATPPPRPSRAPKPAAGTAPVPPAAAASVPVGMEAIRAMLVEQLRAMDERIAALQAERTQIAQMLEQAGSGQLALAVAAPRGAKAAAAPRPAASSTGRRPGRPRKNPAPAEGQAPTSASAPAAAAAPSAEPASRKPRQSISQPALIVEVLRAAGGPVATKDIIPKAKALNPQVGGTLSTGPLSVALARLSKRSVIVSAGRGMWVIGPAAGGAGTSPTSPAAAAAETPAEPSEATGKGADGDSQNSGALASGE